MKIAPIITHFPISDRYAKPNHWVAFLSSVVLNILILKYVLGTRAAMQPVKAEIMAAASQRLVTTV